MECYVLFRCERECYCVYIVSFVIVVGYLFELFIKVVIFNKLKFIDFKEIKVNIVKVGEVFFKECRICWYL